MLHDRLSSEPPLKSIKRTPSQIERSGTAEKVAKAWDTAIDQFHAGNEPKDKQEILAWAQNRMLSWGTDFTKEEFAQVQNAILTKTFEEMDSEDRTHFLEEKMEAIRNARGAQPNISSAA